MMFDAVNLEENLFFKHTIQLKQLEKPLLFLQGFFFCPHEICFGAFWIIFFPNDGNIVVC